MKAIAKKMIAANECFDVKEMRVLSEKVDVYAINQMVRHGLRDQAESVRTRSYKILSSSQG